MPSGHFLVTDISTQEKIHHSSPETQRAHSATERSVSAWRVSGLLYGGISAVALVVGTIILFQKSLSRPVQTTAMTQQQSSGVVFQPTEPGLAAPSVSIAQKTNKNKEKHSGEEKKTKTATSNPLVAKLPPKSASADENSFIVQDVQIFGVHGENGVKGLNRLQAVASEVAVPLQKNIRNLNNT